MPVTFDLAYSIVINYRKKRSQEVEINLRTLLAIAIFLRAIPDSGKVLFFPGNVTQSRVKVTRISSFEFHQLSKNSNQNAIDKTGSGKILRSRERHGNE